MSRPVRIGNAHGFWGDRIEAAAELVAAEPSLDYVSLDFLAEVSMSILAIDRSRNPETGWPRDIVEVVRLLAPYWQGGGQCRLITNAGGLNPIACARACQQALADAGCGDRRIAVVDGDDVLEQLRAGAAERELFRNIDTGEPIASVRERLVTANAYLGAQTVAQALADGADLIITGRVADPSLTVAACAHFHGWSWDDWNQLAGATVAGHLIECGTQVTGGIATDWLAMPHVERIGFPIVEVAEDGNVVVTKPRGSGGRVNEQTVKEQLVYEIGDPAEYLSPDVTVSFLSLKVKEIGSDRVEVRSAQGRPSPSAYKVSATYQDGYRAEGELTIYGADAVRKARLAGESILERLREDGVKFRESLVECLGAGACHPGIIHAAVAPQLRETVLRVAVSDQSRESVERFTRALMPLITAGPPGTTGYTRGRPRVRPVFRYWPCLIDRDRVTPHVEMLSAVGGKMHTEMSSIPAGEGGWGNAPETRDNPDSGALPQPPAGALAWTPAGSGRQLGEVATARSGDKGRNANIGVVARRPQDYELLCRAASVERVARHLGIDDPRRIERFELPNIGALNFLVHGILANGLRVDAQGKALGQVLLEMPID
jgi:Acyclic terpene utilisation family protein AtuA